MSRPFCSVCPFMRYISRATYSIRADLYVLYILSYMSFISASVSLLRPVFHVLYVQHVIFRGLKWQGPTHSRD